MKKVSIPDDWRELLRLFMIRRTRSFIQQTTLKPTQQALSFADIAVPIFPSASL
ncbi:MAG: hypothetical protein R2865_16535 [Deinococcales bacterium]